jgi:hypothetical protein
MWGRAILVLNISGGGVLSPRAHRPRCEADQSPPPSVKLKNEWSYTSIYTYVIRCHAEDFEFICIFKKLNDNFYCSRYIPWLWIFELKLAATVREVAWPVRLKKYYSGDQITCVCGTCGRQGCGMQRIDLALHRDTWPALVNMVMKLSD